MRVRTGLLVLSLLLLLPAAVLAAPRLGWVRAESWAARKGAPATYWPGHALDGRKSTAWCIQGTSTDGGPQSLQLGFQGTGRITALRVADGDQRSKKTFSQHNRARTLVVSDGTYERKVELEDTAKPQEVRLDPPIDAERTVDVRITGAYGSAALTCLSDLVFLSGKKATSGTWMAKDLGYGRRAPLLGVWAAGPEGAPEKFLSLYLDGRFRWIYAPNDPDLKGRHMAGRWSLQGERLLLQVGGRWYGLGLRREAGRDAAGQPVHTLVLTRGKGPVERVDGRYRDRWM